MQISLLPWEGIWPGLHPSVFLADGARVIGDARLGEDVSIWYNTVIRADVHYIEIGARTNIQDLSCLHVENQKFPLILGSDVTVGHSVTLHGCTVHDGCLIGMGAVLLNGCEVGEESLIAAHAIVPEGMKIPPGSLVMGSPAKIRRELSPEERAKIRSSGKKYCGYVRRTLESLESAGLLESLEDRNWHHQWTHCKKV